MQKNINPVDKDSPEYLVAQVAMGRYSLLLVIIFTIVNLVLLLLNPDTYLLFSASGPYFLTLLATAMDGGINGGTYQLTALVISAVILVAYFLCWLLSKENSSWLVTALVLFVLDTLILLGVCFFIFGAPLSGIWDYLIHAWVIYQLAHGVHCANKFRRFSFGSISRSTAEFDQSRNYLDS